jgi:hypothetical protein
MAEKFYEGWVGRSAVTLQSLNTAREVLSKVHFNFASTRAVNPRYESRAKLLANIDLRWFNFTEFGGDLTPTISVKDEQKYNPHLLELRAYLENV